MQGKNIYFLTCWLFSCCQTIRTCTQYDIIRNLQERGTVTSKKAEGGLFPDSCIHTLCHNLIIWFYVLLAQSLCVCQQRIRAWKEPCWGSRANAVTELCILLLLNRLGTKDVQHALFSKLLRHWSHMFNLWLTAKECLEAVKYIVHWSRSFKFIFFFAYMK